MLHFVYELVDPGTNKAHYIGITNNPNLRMQAHISETLTNEQKSGWIQQLLAEGKEPKMKILEVCEDEDTARKQEEYWIQTYIKQGAELTNIQKVKSRPKAAKKVAKTPSPVEVREPMYQTILREKPHLIEMFGEEMAKRVSEEIDKHGPSYVYDELPDELPISFTSPNDVAEKWGNFLREIKSKTLTKDEEKRLVDELYPARSGRE